jgi:hypothetical protein
MKIEYHDKVSGTFTEYVRGGSGDAPQDWSRFDGVLRSLKNILVQELKRRDLWNAPPRYLGIFGGNRWDEADLLEELVLDCFEYVFVRRIRGLQNQARVHSNIDGLVVLNVQHFLHDAQRRHDPLGYRIFEIAHDAVESLLKAGSLHLLAGDPSIRNDTLLGFSLQADDSSIQSPDPSLIRGWNDSLMPDLVTAWHRESVVEELAARVAGLSSEGYAVLRFRDLVHPLKEDARARWLAMVWEGTELAPGTETLDASTLLIPVLEPRQTLEEEQNYQRLLTCIAREIEQSPADERTKGYQRRLLSFLRQWAAALEEGPGAGPPPPDSRMGELLQIPRGRIQGLKEALGNLTNICRGRKAISEEGHPAWSTRKPARVPAQVVPLEARLMKLSQRRERLGRLSLEAIAETTRQPADGALPAVGDTMIFPDAEAGLEWLLVTRDASRGSLFVPLDAMPLVGARDLSLEEQMGEPLTARCGFAVWLADDLVAVGSKARHVDEETIRQVRARVEDVERGTLTPTLFEQEAEADSEYRAWSERLRASSLQIQERLETVERGTSGTTLLSPPLPKRRSWRAFSPAYALAAVLAIAVVGLSVYVQSLRQRIHQAADPILLPSGSAGEIRLGSEERGLETRLVAAGEGHALLYLVFRDVPDSPRYAVRLLNPRGEAWWQSRPFARGEQLLILPVPAEPVRFQLIGLGEDGKASILDDRRLVPEGTKPATP